MKILILLVTLVMSTATRGSGLQPFLEHVHGRAPDVAWQHLKGVGRADMMATSIAELRGWSHEHAWSILEHRQYEVRPIHGWWYSDGLLFGSTGGYQVGTIYRQAYPGELGAYIGDDLLFSGTCGNARKPKPEKRSVLCRTVAQESGSTTIISPTVFFDGYVAGGTATETTWGGDTIECIQKKEVRK
ncbi:MAG: hypothetical protein KBD24_00145 [Candidatus Pacebacteria bacterium]|nr:hypothetical protein [Candidatus Paceibacterota bacterium]